jgi:hypothetical protein
MSGEFTTLNNKVNYILTILGLLPPAGDIMTLSTAQTAVGLKTFTTLPQSAVVPLVGDDLTNKTYVDSLSLPENASLYPPLALVPTAVANTITSMFRMRATIKSASYYKVTASVCCLVTGVGNVTYSSLSFSTKINPILNLNLDNLLLSYANAVATVPAGRNFTMSGTGVFLGEDILNGLPDGLTNFYLNILTNHTVSPVLNPNNQGLMPTTFYFEEVSVSL